MATSGTTTFNLSILDIIEEAYERAGAEVRSGYDLRTARRSLNLLTIEWANKGFNLWTLEQVLLPLTSGTLSYALPADTIDVVEQSIRQTLGGVDTDLLISRIGIGVYASIPVKNAPGRPNQIYVERLIGGPTIKVWPVPPDDTYSLLYWRLRRMEDSSGAATTADIPFRFLPALVAGLAYYLAMKLPDGAQRLDMLKAAYMEQWQMAADEDRDRAPVRFIPDNLSI